MRDRHLAYFQALAEETMDLAGRHVEAWLRRLERELDNLRAAFAHARTREDRGETALRLASALGAFWAYGHIAEGVGWLNEALARGSGAPASARARALLAKAGLCVHLGDLAQMTSLGEASLALFRQTDDRLGLAWCLELLANNLFNERARALAEEVLPLFRKLGSVDGEGRALRALGTGAYRAGDYASAARSYEQAIAVSRAIDDRGEIRWCLDRLYDVSPQRALELGAQEVVRWREAGDEESLIIFLMEYGVMLVAEGDDEQARRTLEEGVQLGQRTGLIALFAYAWDFSMALLALGQAELSLGHVDRAVGRWDQAGKLARDAGVVIVSDVARFMIVSAKIAQGNLAHAAGEVLDCLRLFHKYDYRPAVVCALVQAADLACRSADARRATVLLGAAGAFSRAVEIINYNLDRFLYL
jgi:tetratricopeptide (TPR) repeat protein